MNMRRFAPAVLVLVVATLWIGAPTIASQTAKPVDKAPQGQEFRSTPTTTVDTDKSESKAAPVASNERQCFMPPHLFCLVLVDVLTQDSKTGLPLNELKKNDFRILDDGHQVSILTFDSGAHFGTRQLLCGSS